ncbi:hypothetical protein NDU88_002669 [Pleurodeles waltl]|uniref:Uncharacterized protein n=1 Tax=Pleurodeles waltl TaxID=8319 RepID=A0AAV7TN99_PLEWA|nr:hypothetical protein NDU88_002669 [Pleurodeles waltl]
MGSRILQSPSWGRSLSEEEQTPVRNDQKGEYIGKDLLPELLAYVKQNMGFQVKETPESSSLVSSLLWQFQQYTQLDVPGHPDLIGALHREWKDSDKILLPRFMAKLYPISDMQHVLQDSIPIDFFVASLVGHTLLMKDSVSHDQPVKMIDPALRKVYSGAHLVLRLPFMELKCHNP